MIMKVLETYENFNKFCRIEFIALNFIHYFYIALHLLCSHKQIDKQNRKLELQRTQTFGEQIAVLPQINFLIILSSRKYYF